MLKNGCSQKVEIRNFKTTIKKKKNLGTLFIGKEKNSNIKLIQPIA